MKDERYVCVGVQSKKSNKWGSSQYEKVDKLNLLSTFSVKRV